MARSRSEVSPEAGPSRAEVSVRSLTDLGLEEWTRHSSLPAVRRIAAAERVRRLRLCDLGDSSCGHRSITDCAERRRALSAQA